MSCQLLDLPPEILISILCSLDLRTLISCIATNRHVKSIVDSSILLQYRLVTLAACVEDNPCNAGLNSAQKLVALRKRQTAFAELLPSSICTIQMDNFPIRTSYMLSGGIVAMIESDRKALRWVSLASIEETPIWERLEFDEYILEFGIAVPELIVIVSCTIPPPLFQDLKLHFFEMSMKSPHRKAEEPVINLPISPAAFPNFEVEICGPKVAILMWYDENSWLIPNPGAEIPPNRLLVYDWKHGQLQMDLSRNYSAAVFISTDVILLARGGSLELWSIPAVPEHTAASPEISLQLPELPPSSEYYIRGVYNSMSTDVCASQQPFHSSFADSVVMLDVVTRHRPLRDMFLIIPRRGLLLQIQLAHDGTRRKECLWADWGPPVSRWLDADIFLYQWSTIMCGQRCVFLRPDTSLLLFDFNPYTWRKSILEQAEAKGGGGEPTNRRFVSGPSSKADSFSDLESFEQVDSQLGYVATESREKSYCQGVMMDEEWIVGLNVRLCSSVKATDV
ncbi:hypothetical protein B0H19DRAFT_1162738 [Mycena capillaripes]|nr:hypothetical protein B0H19DRAFT_1162738 [Mycena capillaripes]